MNSYKRRRIMPTNAHIISDSDTGDIKNRLSDAEEQLAALDERIAVARASLNNLLAQHTELTAEVSACKILLAPHKKLPPELLSRIFQYCAPDGISLPSMPYDGPLLLCQIFSYGRRVALRTPTLWNRIMVKLDKDMNMNVGDSLAIARTWIDRSGLSTPLSITMTMDAHTHYTCKWDPVQALVNPYIRRCREIVLDLPLGALQHFLQLPGGLVDNLEVFKAVVAGYEFKEEDWPPKFPVFDSAPRLRSVYFTADSARLKIIGSQLLQLPCSQLTDLHLVDIAIDPRVCLAMLRRCANLIDFTVTVAECEDTLAHSDSIVAPNLLRFKLHFQSFADFQPFLRLLILPALKDFEFLAYFTGSDHALTSLCSRSSFVLEKFAFIDRHFEESALKSLLQHLSSLVELDIRSQASISDSILDMIIRGDLIPKLEVFDFRSVPLNIALRIIQARWRLDTDVVMRGNTKGVPVSRLRKAVVNKKGSEDELTLLASFKEEGLQVEQCHEHH